MSANPLDAGLTPEFQKPEPQQPPSLPQGAAPAQPSPAQPMYDAVQQAVADTPDPVAGAEFQAIAEDELGKKKKRFIEVVPYAIREARKPWWKHPLSPYEALPGSAEDWRGAFKTVYVPRYEGDTPLDLLRRAEKQAVEERSSLRAIEYYGMKAGKGLSLGLLSMIPGYEEEMTRARREGMAQPLLGTGAELTGLVKSPVAKGIGRLLGPYLDPFAEKVGQAIGRRFGKTTFRSLGEVFEELSARLPTTHPNGARYRSALSYLQAVLEMVGAKVDSAGRIILPEAVDKETVLAVRNLLSFVSSQAGRKLGVKVVVGSGGNVGFGALTEKVVTRGFQAAGRAAPMGAIFEASPEVGRLLEGKGSLGKVVGAGAHGAFSWGTIGLILGGGSALIEDAGSLVRGGFRRQVPPSESPGGPPQLESPEAARSRRVSNVLRNAQETSQPPHTIVSRPTPEMWEGKVNEPRIVRDRRTGEYWVEWEWRNEDGMVIRTWTKDGLPPEALGEASEAPGADVLNHELPRPEPVETPGPLSPEQAKQAMELPPSPSVGLGVPPTRTAEKVDIYPAIEEAEEAFHGTGDPRVSQAVEEVADSLARISGTVGALLDSAQGTAVNGAARVIAESAADLAGRPLRGAARILGEDVKRQAFDGNIKGPEDAIQVPIRQTAIRWAEDIAETAARHEVRLPSPAPAGSPPAVQLAWVVKAAQALEAEGVTVPDVTIYTPMGRTWVSWDALKAAGEDPVQFITGAATLGKSRWEVRQLSGDPEARQRVEAEFQARRHRAQAARAERQQVKQASNDVWGFDTVQPILVGYLEPSTKNVTLPGQPEGPVPVFQHNGRLYAVDRGSSSIVDVTTRPVGDALGWWAESANFRSFEGSGARYELGPEGVFRYLGSNPEAADAYKAVMQEIAGVDAPLPTRFSGVILRLLDPRPLTSDEIREMEKTLDELEEELSERPRRSDTAILVPGGEEALTLDEEHAQRLEAWTRARALLWRAGKMLTARKTLEGNVETFQQPVAFADSPSERVRGKINIQNTLGDMTIRRYEATPISVCIREAIQNAVGAVRRRYGDIDPDDSKITFRAGNPDENTFFVEIIDEGDGMSPETIKEHFLSLANPPTLEEIEKGSTPGGFGIGIKAALAFAHVEVETCDGKTVSILRTDPVEYLEDLSGDLEVRPATPEDRQGTRIRMTFPVEGHLPEGRSPEDYQWALTDDREERIEEFYESVAPWVAAFALQNTYANQMYSKHGKVTIVLEDFLGEMAGTDEVNVDHWEAQRFAQYFSGWVEGNAIVGAAFIHIPLAQFMVDDIMRANGWEGSSLAEAVKKAVKEGSEADPKNSFFQKPIPAEKKPLLGLSDAFVEDDPFEKWLKAGLSSPRKAPRYELQSFCLDEEDFCSSIGDFGTEIYVVVFVRGVPQFTRAFDISSLHLPRDPDDKYFLAGGNLFFLNIDPTVDERDPDYPFQLSRERFTKTFDGFLQNWAASYFLTGHRSAAVDRVARFLETAKRNRVTTLEFAPASGADTFNPTIFQTTTTVSQGAVDKLRKSKAFGALLHFVHQFEMAAFDGHAEDLARAYGGSVTRGQASRDRCHFVGWELTESAGGCPKTMGRCWSLGDMSDADAHALGMANGAAGTLVTINPYFVGSRSGVLGRDRLKPMFGCNSYTELAKKDPEAFQAIAREAGTRIGYLLLSVLIHEHAHGPGLYGHNTPEFLHGVQNLAHILSDKVDSAVHSLGDFFVEHPELLDDIAKVYAAIRNDYINEVESFRPFTTATVDIEPDGGRFDEPGMGEGEPAGDSVPRAGQGGAAEGNGPLAGGGAGAGREATVRGGPVGTSPEDAEARSGVGGAGAWLDDRLRWWPIPGFRAYAPGIPDWAAVPYYVRKGQRPEWWYVYSPRLVGGLTPADANGAGFFIAYEDVEAAKAHLVMHGGEGYLYAAQALPVNELVISPHAGALAYFPDALADFVRTRFEGDVGRFFEEVRQPVNPQTGVTNPVVVEMLNYLWSKPGSLLDSVRIQVPGEGDILFVRDPYVFRLQAVGGVDLPGQHVRQKLFAPPRNPQAYRYIRQAREWAKAAGSPTSRPFFRSMQTSGEERFVYFDQSRTGFEQEVVVLAPGKWARSDLPGYAKLTDFVRRRAVKDGLLTKDALEALDEVGYEGTLYGAILFAWFTLGMVPPGLKGVILRETGEGSSPRMVIVTGPESVVSVQDIVKAARSMDESAPLPWTMVYEEAVRHYPGLTREEHVRMIAKALVERRRVPPHVLADYPTFYEKVVEKDPYDVALTMAANGEALPEWAFLLLSDADRTTWIVNRIRNISFPSGRYRIVRKARLLKALEGLGLPQAGTGKRSWPFGWMPPPSALVEIDKALRSALKRNRLLLSAADKLLAEIEELEGETKGRTRELSLEEAYEIVAQWRADPNTLNELHPDLLWAITKHFAMVSEVENPFDVLRPVTLLLDGPEGRRQAEVMAQEVRKWATEIGAMAARAAVNADVATQQQHVDALNPVSEAKKRMTRAERIKLFFAHPFIEAREMLLTLDNLMMHTQRMETVVGPDLQAPDPATLFKLIQEGQLEKNPWAILRAAILRRSQWLYQVHQELEDIFEVCAEDERLDAVLWRVLNGDLTPEVAEKLGLGDLRNFTVKVPRGEVGRLIGWKSKTTVDVFELADRVRKVMDTTHRQWREAWAMIYEEERIAPAIIEGWAAEWDLEKQKATRLVYEELQKALEADEIDPEEATEALGWDLEKERKRKITKGRVLRSLKGRINTSRRKEAKLAKIVQQVRDTIEAKRQMRDEALSGETGYIENYAPHQEALTKERAKEMASELDSTDFSNFREPPPITFVFSKRRKGHVDRKLPSFTMTFVNYLSQASSYIWLGPIEKRVMRMSKQLPQPFGDMMESWILRVLGVIDVMERHFDNGYKDWFGKQGSPLDPVIRLLTSEKISPAHDPRVGSARPTRHALTTWMMRTVAALIHPIWGTALQITQYFMAGSHMGTSPTMAMASPFILGAAWLSELPGFLKQFVSSTVETLFGWKIAKKDVKKLAMLASWESFMEFYGMRVKRGKTAPPTPIRAAASVVASIYLYGLYLADLFHKSATFRAFKWWAKWQGVPDTPITIGNLEISARDYVALYHTERIFPNYSAVGRPPAFSTLMGRVWGSLRIYPLAMRDIIRTDRHAARKSITAIQRATGKREPGDVPFRERLAEWLMLITPTEYTQGATGLFKSPGAHEREYKIPILDDPLRRPHEEIAVAKVYKLAFGDGEAPALIPGLASRLREEAPLFRVPGESFRAFLQQNATAEERKAIQQFLALIAPLGEIGAPSEEAVAKHRWRYFARSGWIALGAMVMLHFFHAPNWITSIAPASIGAQTAALSLLDSFYQLVNATGKILFEGETPENKAFFKEAYTDFVSQVVGGRLVGEWLKAKDQDPEQAMERLKAEFRDETRY